MHFSDQMSYEFSKFELCFWSLILCHGIFRFIGILLVLLC